MNDLKKSVHAQHWASHSINTQINTQTEENQEKRPEKKKMINSRRQKRTEGRWAKEILVFFCFYFFQSKYNHTLTNFFKLRPLNRKMTKE